MSPGNNGVSVRARGSRGLLLAAAAVFNAHTATGASEAGPPAGLRYTVVDLGYFQARELDERAGLNDSAQVAAWRVVSQTRVAAVQLAADGSDTVLGLPDSVNSFAFGINNQAEVVGILESPEDLRDSRAFLVQHGALQILPTLGGRTAAARYINRGGLIVGNAQTAALEVHAAAWVEGAVRDLGTLAGGNFSRAFAANDRNDIVGEANSSMNGKARAVIWLQNRIRGLGLLPHGSFSSAQAINGRGVAVGYADDAQGRVQAVRFQHGRVRSLGSLGDDPSSALGINEAGEIVGSSSIAEAMMRAFLWKGGHMYDLNQLIPRQSGWLLLGAYRINTNGAILAYGFRQGRTHLCVLAPTKP